jgi:hypothetical protein
MPLSKLTQLNYESETWKRLLSFIMDENNHLKNRISDILNEKFDKRALDGLEDFQSKFIDEDELLALLRNDVAQFDKLVVKEIVDEEKVSCNILKKIKNLRNNIGIAEEQFSKLKLNFNTYLLESL